MRQKPISPGGSRKPRPVSPSSSPLTVSAARLRRLLQAAGCQEITVTGEHVCAVQGLPPLHTNPFDRIMLAQALIEGATLLTADRTLERYGPPVVCVA